MSKDNITFKNKRTGEITTIPKGLGGDFHVLKLEELKKGIDFLSRHPGVYIEGEKKSSVDQEVYKHFQEVKFGISLLYDTPFHEEIVKYIKNLNKPANIIPGTVGAYLFGCWNDDQGIRLGCSFTCSNSILPPNISKDFPCDGQVWAYKSEDDKTITYIVISENKHNNKAYVLVSNDFTGFSSQEIHAFKNKFSEAQIYKSVDNRYVAITEMISVDNLPLHVSPIHPDHPGHDNEGNKNGSGNNFGAGAIIVILLILLIIVVCYRYRG